jgi:hypothetical protein
MMNKYEPQALQQLGMQQSSFNPLMEASTQQLVYGPDGKVYGSPAQARAAGVNQYYRQDGTPYPTSDAGGKTSPPLPGPDVIGFPGDRGTPFDPSAGIGEFERRQFQPDLTPRLFDSSAGGGDFEARQFPPQQPQALQQMGMRQQPYQPLPQMSAMQPLLQQFRTQQRPYQSPYQSPFQQRSGQMSPDGTMGGQSNSAYSYNNNSRLNNLAPLNMNALNFSY